MPSSGGNVGHERPDKTREQLISENEELRRRVAAIGKGFAGNQSATALLQVPPLGIHECDTEGRITFVNPSQEAITGYTADELVGTYIWDRIEPGPEKDACLGIWIISSRSSPPQHRSSPRTSGRVVRRSMSVSIGTTSETRRGKSSGLFASSPTSRSRSGPRRHCREAKNDIACWQKQFPIRSGGVMPKEGRLTATAAGRSTPGRPLKKPKGTDG